MSANNYEGLPVPMYIGAYVNHPEDTLDIVRVDRFYPNSIHPIEISDLNTEVVARLNPSELLTLISAYHLGISVEEIQPEETRNESIELDINCCNYNEVEHKIQENHPDCSICMEKFEDNSIISKLECGHIFHHKCIQEWGKWKQQCAYCRSTIAYKYINQEQNEVFNSTRN